jgi:hypothetical protein
MNSSIKSHEENRTYKLTITRPQEKNQSTLESSEIALYKNWTNSKVTKALKSTMLDYARVA